MLPSPADSKICVVVLPPAGGVFLLVVEHKSDYVRWVYGYLILRLRGCWALGRLGGKEKRMRGVDFTMSLADGVWMNRFHAWQSSLLFSAIFVLHLIFSWSSILSWMLFVVDLGLIGFLTMHAYRDGMSPFTILGESFGEFSRGRTGVLTRGS